MEGIDEFLLSEEVKSSGALKGKFVMFQTMLFPEEAEAYEKVLKSCGASAANVFTEGVPEEVRIGDMNTVFSGTT